MENSIREADVEVLNRKVAGYGEPIEKYVEPVLDPVTKALDRLKELREYVVLMRIEPDPRRVEESWIVFGIGRQGESAEEMFSVRYDADHYAIVKTPESDETPSYNTVKLDKLLFAILNRAMDRLVRYRFEDRVAEICKVERFIPRPLPPDPLENE